MKIAIEGCAHGELEKIYSCIQHLEQVNNTKVDLLLCCGDFQSVRNNNDLCCMAVPPKYHDICSFHKYYSGEAVAPILTIFIGGNHEASNYLQELPYGGWVAPNIYYLGYAGVVSVGGIRIAGLSGIFKGHDYLVGHHEVTPYTDNTKRSVYHVRNLEIFRLKQLSGPIDAVLSHDWPRSAVQHGNINQLLRNKPFFAKEIEEGTLGSQPAADLLDSVRPLHWFAAHLHCRYSALVPHSNADTHTKFLALDKCLPKRRFLQVLDIPHKEDLPIRLEYDLEWLTILHLTNHLLTVNQSRCHMPGENSNERFNFTPTQEELDEVLNKLSGNLVIPQNFVQTAEVYDPNSTFKKQPQPQSNPQTVTLCNLLQLDDPVSLVLLKSGNILQPSKVQQSPKPSQSLSTPQLPLDDNASPKRKSNSLDMPLDDDSEKTFVEFNSDSSFSSPKTPLKLPSPKKFLSEPLVSLNKEPISITIVEDVEGGCDDSVASAVCSTPLSIKKSFKRRNESLYLNKSIDD